MAKIFVSHSRRDKDLAARVAEGLRKRGHTILSDIDGMPAGTDWRQALSQALKAAPVVVSVMTKNSVSSAYPMSEVGAARILGKVLIPLVFDGIDYPSLVSDLYCVNVTEEILETVLDRIHGDMAHFAAENKKVFIVHGQNEAKKLELKDFLAKLNLDPMILHQQNDLGKTIIEKFEHYASQCTFAIVLLTPDDQAAPANATTEAKWRARQNVILELGWFMAKLGRERVLLLHQGQLEIPSDILGVVYASFTNLINEAGETIRERLKGVGLLS
ncbi:MAG TPA: TIR domain-containing protein [Gemmataceae bacterium]|jgi:predicted nucleotide-binding protein|nr:TIR domain-containing protein [Gemmataceae bacterium]